MGLLTDDCDINQNELETFTGGNGDFYIAIKANKAAYSVRIATSGGIAPIGVRLAIANLHREMEAAGLNLSPSKNELGVGGVSKSVCRNCGKPLDTIQSRWGYCDTECIEEHMETIC